MPQETYQSGLIKSENPLEEFGNWLENQNYHGLFILTDTEVAEEAFPVIEPYLENLGLKGVLTIPPGEANKTIECCEDVWHELIRNDAKRNSLLINLGGGLVTDLGGFAGATFKRGMPFVHVPTTLLGMVDASIGGKTGVNFEGLKNQVGLFQEPEQVVIAPEFLDSLEDRQLLSGYAEMVKQALIADVKLWDRLQQLDPLYQRDKLKSCIPETAEIKQQLVAADPYEKGPRKKLNFGHTIGHALETYSQERDEDPLLHGEAIAIGMQVEANLSTQHVLLDEGTFHSISQYLNRLFPSYALNDEGIEAVIDRMKADKKRNQDTFNFTLLVEAGQSDIDIQLSKVDVAEGLSTFFLNRQ